MSRPPGSDTPAKTGSSSASALVRARSKAASVCGISPKPCARARASVRSASSDSLSLAFVEFDLQYDIREKVQQVRERVAAVRGELPLDIEPPIITTITQISGNASLRCRSTR